MGSWVFILDKFLLRDLIGHNWLVIFSVIILNFLIAKQCFTDSKIWSKTGKSSNWVIGQTNRKAKRSPIKNRLSSVMQCWLMSLPPPPQNKHKVSYILIDKLNKKGRLQVLSPTRFIRPSVNLKELQVPKIVRVWITSLHKFLYPVTFMSLLYAKDFILYRYLQAKKDHPPFRSEDPGFKS